MSKYVVILDDTVVGPFDDKETAGAVMALGCRVLPTLPFRPPTDDEIEKARNYWAEQVTISKRGVECSTARLKAVIGFSELTKITGP